jgi:hypothetical protein
MRIIRLNISIPLLVQRREGVDIQLGVLVGTVSLEVLSDRDGLLDEVVKVLGDGWGETWLLVQF